MTLSLLALLHMLPFLEVTVSSAQPSLKAANERFQLRVVEVQGFPDFRSEFEIRDGEKTSRLEISIRATRYKALLLPPKARRGVAIGLLPRGGYALAVIDLQTASLQDQIWCYGYWLSPTGRHLLVETHYPRMGLPKYRRSILLLYDLEAGRAGNRRPDIETFDRANAGRPVYPSKNRENQSYDVTLDEQRVYADEVLWESDGSAFIFLEYLESHKQNFLVRLEFSDDVQNSSETKFPIDLTPYVDTSNILPRRLSEIRERGYMLHLTGLNWREEGRSVVLTPYPQEWLPQEIVVKLAENK